MIARTSARDGNHIRDGGLFLIWQQRQGSHRMPTAQIEATVAIHKILFATDFTEASRKAFKYTKALARHFQASVTTAHVMRASASDWPKFRTDPEYQKLCRETKQMLDRLSRQLHQAGLRQTVPCWMETRSRAFSRLSNTTKQTCSFSGHMDQET